MVVFPPLCMPAQYEEVTTTTIESLINIQQKNWLHFVGRGSAYIYEQLEYLCARVPCGDVCVFLLCAVETEAAMKVKTLFPLP